MRNHRSSYPDPIRVKRGDGFRLTGREDVWDGHRWLWAAAEDGREGWVPDDLPCKRDGSITAAYDYSAHKLDVVSGENVELMATSHGWAWCRQANGDEGWIPLHVLDRS